MKVIGIIGERKSGKTSLIAYVIPYLKEYGAVGCIKHAHELDLDTPIAKDTDRFVNAGAEVVIGASEQKTVTICRGKTLDALIEEMANSGIEFVLVEGFKSSGLPKIALSDFADDGVATIIKRVDVQGELGEELVKELVNLISSLDDY